LIRAAISKFDSDECCTFLHPETMLCGSNGTEKQAYPLFGSIVVQSICGDSRTASWPLLRIPADATVDALRRLDDELEEREGAATE
jgi:hypothetical protein